MKNRQDTIYLIVIISTGILFLGIIMYSFRSSAIYEGLDVASIGKPLITPNGLSYISGSAFTNQNIPRDKSINLKEIERLLQIDRTFVEDQKITGYFIRPSNDSSSPRLDFENPPTEESLKSNPSKKKYKLGSSLKRKSEDAKSSLQDSKSSHEKDSKRFSGAQDSVVSGSGIGKGSANVINP